MPIQSLEEAVNLIEVSIDEVAMLTEKLEVAETAIAAGKLMAQSILMGTDPIEAFEAFEAAIYDFENYGK